MIQAENVRNFMSLNHFNLDHQDFIRLRLFLEEFQDDIYGFACINDSGHSRSFLVRFQQGAFGGQDAFVLKIFQKKVKEHYQAEVHNLQQAYSINQHIPDNCVYVPQIVWSNPDDGLFATRWIPGEDLDIIIKSCGRWWTWHSPRSQIKDISLLIEWIRRFTYLGQVELDISQWRNQDTGTWERYLSWLSDAKHFDAAWRRKMVTRLQVERKWLKNAKILAGPVHGDFTPWNIRRDEHGHLWVMDWQRLEISHWLEAAYRFFYALKLSSLSPLTRPGYYQSIYTALERQLWEMEPDRGLHRYFRLCAIIRHLFFMCRRPAKDIKSRLIQRFWVGELSQRLR